MVGFVDEDSSFEVCELRGHWLNGMVWG